MQLYAICVQTLWRSDRDVALASRIPAGFVAGIVPEYCLIIVMSHRDDHVVKDSIVYWVTMFPSLCISALVWPCKRAYIVPLAWTSHPRSNECRIWTRATRLASVDGQCFVSACRPAALYVDVLESIVVEAAWK